MEEENWSIKNNEIQTKLLLQDDDDRGHNRKGGMKTIPFIIVNGALDTMATNGFNTNMIIYLMDIYHMDAVTSTTVLFIWGALSNGLSIFGAYLSDDYLGRFRVIVIGCLSSLLGMIFLWLTSMLPKLRPSFCDEIDTSTCVPPTPTQLAFLYSSFILISIGSGCISPCSIAFGADQLKDDRDPNNQSRIDSYLNWFYASTMMSTFIAVTVIVYAQTQLGWAVGLAIPMLLKFFGSLMFLVGSSLYVKVEASESLFSGSVQALVVAFKNRNIGLNDDVSYNHSNDLDRVELTDNLRFLNKACVIRNFNMGSSAMDPWSLSTVEKVEALKSLIRILPVWSSGFMMFILVGQNFPTIQAEAMNRYITSSFEIPAASLSLFIVLTVILWIIVYDRILVPLLASYTLHPRGIHPKTRMGIGILVSVIAMVVSAIVETIRRDMATSTKNQKIIVEMSAMWLVPQHVVLGLAEGLFVIGQLEFFYSELPSTMASFAMALIMLSNGIAGLLGSLLVNMVDSITSNGGKVSWLLSDINEGHLDYFYWLLSFLNFVNFFYFVICWRVYRNISSLPETRLTHGLGEEGSTS